MVIKHQELTCLYRQPLRSKADALSDGITFVEALNEKYVAQEEFDDQFKLPKDRSISTEITFVGFGSVSTIQKQLRRLASIDLSDRKIKSAGDLTGIFGSLDRVTVLNLANNQLTWQETIKILSCLPNLKEIILSKNELRACENIDFPTEPFKKLISITIGGINLDWSNVVAILSRIWKSIDHVDLWDNNLTNDSLKLSCPNSFIERISSLTLSHNFLPDLGWIDHIGPLENLKELDVSRCRLQTIDLSTSIIHRLKSLSMLNISYNNLTDWSNVSTLNQLPELKHLICNDNPLFIKENSAKAFTVARISKLKYLNREEITAPFRRDSEISYLRDTFKAAREIPPTDLDRLHPRYRELVEIYGVPEDLNSRHVIDKYITVDLCYHDKSIKKKLPCDMRVSNLQMLCKRLFKLTPSIDIEIICHEAVSNNDAIHYPLNKEGQTLHFFSVKNNDRLIINELG